MDAVDREILSALQQDGRLTLTELAERVHLSLSPCHRRLRALERSGAITGYRARLDAVALGLTFEALVFATMRDSTRDTLAVHQPAEPRHRGAAVTAGAIEITAGQLALPPVDDVLIVHKIQNALATAEL